MKLCWSDDQAITQVREVLKKDEVALLSSDTILGLFAQCSQQGFNALSSIKQRENKPFLMMIPSMNLLDRFVDQDFSDDLRRFIELAWPGPITIIFKARQDLPDYMKSSDGKVAIRIPDHAGLLALLEQFEAIFSTSANIHTESVPVHLEDVDSSIINAVSIICTDCSDTFSVVPSTIVDCSGNKVILVRKGEVLPDRLQQQLDKLLDN